MLHYKTLYTLITLTLQLQLHYFTVHHTTVGPSTGADGRVSLDLSSPVCRWLQRKIQWSRKLRKLRKPGSIRGQRHRSCQVRLLRRQNVICFCDTFVELVVLVKALELGFARVWHNQVPALRHCRGRILRWSPRHQKRDINIDPHISKSCL